MKVLIANRGEIARRIERTCVRLGHQVVGVWVASDSGSQPPVLAGDVVEIPSYLDQAAILAAASSSGATAVHPGFGFLAENAAFAQAVIDAGFTWIGPTPQVIDQMGSKIRAREIAEAANVPLIPGYVDSQNDADLAVAADRIGFPVLVKASAGGGGKGIRIAHSADEFAGALNEARGEADRSFGDTDVMVERYIEQPRHIEVQIIGDKHGNVFHLGTRECSIQRRYQKLFEEAPAPNLPEATRFGLHDAAVQLARAVDYDSAGTVEFIVDDATGEHFFLEMNTRLQVEHPVTEEITGLDLVELMVIAASGDELPDLSHVEFSGHSLEARITAEDASAGFLPTAGTVSALKVPEDVRWESALSLGTEVTPEYDAMIAKLIVQAEDRAAALASMRDALDSLWLGGVTTTTGFHRWLVDQPAVVTGRVTTRFLDEIELPAPVPVPVQAAAQAWLHRIRIDQGHQNRPQPGSESVWHQLPRLSFTPHRSERVIGLRDQSDGRLYEVVAADAAGDAATGATASSVRAVEDFVHGRPVGGSINLTVQGQHFALTVVDRSELWAPAAADRAGSGNALTSPFPAAVAEVHVVAGDTVETGQVLVVIEAMKMLHSLKADGAATIAEVLVAPGDHVTGGQSLITFETETRAEESP